MRYFYAFEYWGGLNTRSASGIAGSAHVFETRKDRDDWCAKGERTSDMRGFMNRQPVLARKIRKMTGESVEGHKYFMEICKDTLQKIKEDKMFWDKLKGGVK